MLRSIVYALAILLASAAIICGEDPNNIHSLPSDLNVPEVTNEVAAAGRRVRIYLPEYKETDLYHVVYLPPEWNNKQKLPVIFEYPGNGGYKNKYGDISNGRVEDCKLGYGISGGHGFIWVSLPFFDTQTKAHTITWWGDADATATYCRAAVAQTCRDFGGDPTQLILTGFSRGAIACSYIGLRDDETAQLWRAIITHSHFDGVRNWNYPDSTPQAAQVRLSRLKGRPLFASHEESVDDIASFFAKYSIEGKTLALPYVNHTDEWLLKDIPERTELRSWLNDVIHNNEHRAKDN